MLDRLDDLDPSCLDGGYFRPGFGTFRVEWERAAWNNAGRRGAEAKAKTTLLQWQLHTLLAHLTGELCHHYEAFLARPDLFPTWTALGRSLAGTGNAIEAVRYLRRAVADNPFDREAARSLFQALESVNNVDSRAQAGTRPVPTRPGRSPSDSGRDLVRGAAPRWERVGFHHDSLLQPTRIHDPMS